MWAFETALPVGSVAEFVVAGESNPTSATERQRRESLSRGFTPNLKIEPWRHSRERTVRWQVWSWNKEKIEELNTVQVKVDWPAGLWVWWNRGRGRTWFLSLHREESLLAREERRGSSKRRESWRWPPKHDNIRSNLFENIWRMMEIPTFPMDLMPLKRHMKQTNQEIPRHTMSGHCTSPNTSIPELCFNRWFLQITKTWSRSLFISLF